MASGVTLGDLDRYCKELRICCPDCGREQLWEISDLPFPPQTPVYRVGKLMKCSACGSRDMEARVPLRLVASR
jgi:hypothetical protein